MGVRVRCVMKWHSLYQSVSHSGTPVVLEYSLPLKPASLHAAAARQLGSSRSAPSCLFGSPSLHRQLLSQLYKLPPFSLLFPPLQPWLSEHGKRGRYAKRCGIFLSSLAPIANPHKALWPFLHAFRTLRLSLGLLYLYEKLRFSADRVPPPGLLASARFK